MAEHHMNVEPLTSAIFRSSNPAGSLAAIVMMAFLLIVPAVWNGIPLFYYDSVDYLRLSFTFDLPVFRTASYGVFAGFARLLGSLWAVIVVQVLMIAYTLWITARTLAPDMKPMTLVAVVSVLCLVTGLPWYTSQVMADAFSGTVVLGVTALALSDKSIGRLHEVLLTVVTAIGTAVHTTHILVASGLVVTLIGLFLLKRRMPCLPNIRLVPPLTTIVLALCLATSMNWIITSRVFLVQPTATLMLGLFVENGLAKQFLDDTCPEQPDSFRLCAHRNQLPDNAADFLWGSDKGLLERLGGWKNTELTKEAQSIVKGSMKAYPIDFIRQSIVFTLRQFRMIESGDGLKPMNWHLEGSIREFYPTQLDAFLNAHQQQNGISLRFLHPIELTVYFASVLLLPVLAWMVRRHGNGPAMVLPLLVIMPLLGNAFICGAGSAPYHRYQGRMAWVPTFALVLIASPAPHSVHKRSIRNVPPRLSPLHGSDCRIRHLELADQVSHAGARPPDRHDFGRGQLGRYGHRPPLADRVPPVVPGSSEKQVAWVGALAVVTLMQHVQLARIAHGQSVSVPVCVSPCPSDVRIDRAILGVFVEMARPGPACVFAAGLVDLTPEVTGARAMLAAIPVGVFATALGANLGL
jgi:hypothetical protein